MKTSRRLAAFFFVTIIALVSAPSYAGSNFKTSRVSQLDLGSFKAQDAMKWFGRPEMIWSDRERTNFITLTYAYVKADGELALVRRLDLEFKSGVFNSFNFFSSFPEDRTVVQSDLKAIIKEGMTMDEVKAAARRPDGKGRLPSNLSPFVRFSGKVDEVWVWNSLVQASKWETDPYVNTRFFACFENGIVSAIHSEVEIKTGSIPAYKGKRK